MNKFTSVVLALLAATLCAQPLSRLRGRVASGVDGPLAATVRVEALYGFRGEDYVGQKTYEIRTNAKGEWALIGFKAGGWVFEAWADGRLPDAIVLPITLGAASSSGVAGDTPQW